LELLNASLYMRLIITSDKLTDAISLWIGLRNALTDNRVTRVALEAAVAPCQFEVPFVILGPLAVQLYTYGVAANIADEVRRLHRQRKILRQCFVQLCRDTASDINSEISESMMDSLFPEIDLEEVELSVGEDESEEEQEQQEEEEEEEEEED